MANFKRKRPKEFTIHYCGYRHCSIDKTKFRGNGRDRYLPSQWKRFRLNRPWRYYNISITD